MVSIIESPKIAIEYVDFLRRTGDGVGVKTGVKVGVGERAGANGID